jgi:hypothetical protein
MKMDKKIIKKPDLNEQKYCKTSLYFMLMKNLMLTIYAISAYHH